MISRREFVAGLATGIAGCAVTNGAEAKSIELIDTHTHFYDPERSQGVPWPPPSDKLLYRRVLPPEYQALSRPHGVAGTIVVEASPRLEDNDWLLELAAREPFILGVVGNLDPLHGDFPGHFQRLAMNPRFVGIRIPGKLLIQRGRDVALVKALSGLASAGRSLDLNGSRDYLPAVAPVAKQVPELRIVLDHVGSAGDPRELSDDWRAAMSAAAECPNVHCKVSGLPEQAKRSGAAAPTDSEYYRPILDFVFQRFGPERLIWGSNWPVSDKGAPFAEVVKIARDYFGTMREEIQRAVFAENARRFYRWPAR